MSSGGDSGIGEERVSTRAHFYRHRRTIGALLGLFNLAAVGSAALALAYVANGRFDAFVQNGGLSPWDVAAGGLIAERAGAVVTDLSGGAWWKARPNGPRVTVVAAPAAQHGALLDLLRSLKTTVQTRR